MKKNQQLSPNDQEIKLQPTPESPSESTPVNQETPLHKKGAKLARLLTPNYKKSHGLERYPDDDLSKIRIDTLNILSKELLRVRMTKESIKRNKQIQALETLESELTKDDLNLTWYDELRGELDSGTFKGGFYKQDETVSALKNKKILVRLNKILEEKQRTPIPIPVTPFTPTDRPLQQTYQQTSPSPKNRRIEELRGFITPKQKSKSPSPKTPVKIGSPKTDQTKHILSVVKSPGSPGGILISEPHKEERQRQTIIPTPAIEPVLPVKQTTPPALETQTVEVESIVIPTQDYTQPEPPKTAEKPARPSSPAPTKPASIYRPPVVITQPSEVITISEMEAEKIPLLQKRVVTQPPVSPIIAAKTVHRIDSPRLGNSSAPAPTLQTPSVENIYIVSEREKLKSAILLLNKASNYQNEHKDDTGYKIRTAIKLLCCCFCLTDKPMDTKVYQIGHLNAVSKKLGESDPVQDWRAPIRGALKNQKLTHSFWKKTNAAKALEKALEPDPSLRREMLKKL